MSNLKNIMCTFLFIVFSVNLNKQTHALECYVCIDCPLEDQYIETCGIPPPSTTPSSETDTTPRGDTGTTSTGEGNTITTTTSGAQEVITTTEGQDISTQSTTELTDEEIAEPLIDGNDLSNSMDEAIYNVKMVNSDKGSSMNARFRRNMEYLIQDDTPTPRCVHTTYTINGTLYTARGCTLQSNETIACRDTIGDFTGPLDSCRTCDTDRCNSAAVNTIASLLLVIGVIISFSR